MSPQISSFSLGSSSSRSWSHTPDTIWVCPFARLRLPLNLRIFSHVVFSAIRRSYSEAGHCGCPDWSVPGLPIPVSGESVSEAELSVSAVSAVGESVPSEGFWTAVGPAGCVAGGFRVCVFRILEASAGFESGIMAARVVVNRIQEKKVDIGIPNCIYSYFSCWFYLIQSLACFMC